MTKEGENEYNLIPVDFGILPTKYPYSLTISQADAERVLLDRLVELGGEVVRPKALTALAQHANCVTASFNDGDAITARYVVGADGMRGARARSHRVPWTRICRRLCAGRVDLAVHRSNIGLLDVAAEDKRQSRNSTTIR